MVAVMPGFVWGSRDKYANAPDLHGKRGKAKRRAANKTARRARRKAR